VYSNPYFIFLCLTNLQKSNGISFFTLLFLLKEFPLWGPSIFLFRYWRIINNTIMTIVFSFLFICIICIICVICSVCGICMTSSIRIIVVIIFWSTWSPSIRLFTQWSIINYSIISTIISSITIIASISIIPNIFIISSISIISNIFCTLY